MKKGLIFKTLAFSLALLALSSIDQYDGQATSQTGATLTCSSWQQGAGMMGNGGMMNGWSTNDYMWGMMSGSGMMRPIDRSAQPISLTQAREQLNTYLADCENGATIAEVVPFASYYYARLTDADGANLTEVLVDRYSGNVYPEPGPNMMWNTRSGMYGGSGATQYDAASATQYATAFLATYDSDAEVLGTQPFPSYYTISFGDHEDDHIEGLLSVNASTGDIWVHTWIGAPLSEDDGIGHD